MSSQIVYTSPSSEARANFVAAVLEIGKSENQVGSFVLSINCKPGSKVLFADRFSMLAEMSKKIASTYPEKLTQLKDQSKLLQSELLQQQSELLQQQSEHIQKQNELFKQQSPSLQKQKQTEFIKKENEFLEKQTDFLQKQSELLQKQMKNEPFTAECFTLIFDSLNDSKRKLQEVFDKIFLTMKEKAQKKLNEATKELNHFRKDRSAEHLKAVQVVLDKLQKRLSLLSTLTGAFPPSEERNDREAVRVEKEKRDAVADLTAAQERLIVLISSNSPLVKMPLLNQLAVLSKQSNVSESEKGKFGLLFNYQVVQLMPVEHQKRLNEKIPEVQRYADLDRFEQAYKEVVLSTIKDMVKEQGLNEQEETDFYRILHQLAFGPEDVDPVQWAKGEMHRLAPFFSIALAKVRSNPSITNSKKEETERSVEVESKTGNMEPGTEVKEIETSSNTNTSPSTQGISAHGNEEETSIGTFSMFTVIADYFKKNSSNT